MQEMLEKSTFKDFYVAARGQWVKCIYVAMVMHCPISLSTLWICLVGNVNSLSPSVYKDNDNSVTICCSDTWSDMICISAHHSVESPSMVDPQWDIWYWGSKWNLHTVCWSAVGCEWGTTSVYFGILMFALSLVDFLSLLLSPSTYFKIFYFCQKYHLKNTYKIFKKIHVGLKFEWGL